MVIVPVDAERETGFRRYANEEVATRAAENSDALIPIAAVDPAKARVGEQGALGLVREFGVMGFNFHPTMQGFCLNDRMAYPLSEAIAETGALAVFHNGQTGVGSRMRGGNRTLLTYSISMHFGDVAVVFPDVLIRYAKTLLTTKMLFRSDWPMIAPENWLAAFDAAPFKETARPLILKDNAMRLLGVDRIGPPKRR